MIHEPAVFVEKLKRDQPFNMESEHIHDTYEIYYLVAGERYYYINDRIYALQAGDLVFIHKNQLHRTTNKGGAEHERILINFDDFFIRNFKGIGLDELSLFQGESFLLRLSVHEQGRISDLLYMMLREQSDGGLMYRPYLQTLLVQLLIVLGRVREEKAESVNPENSDIQKRIYSIVEYLNAHYPQGLNLDELAQHFFISPTYLCRIFKQTTGFTIFEYMNHIRVQKAQSFLIHTNWKITKIAEEAGFDSIAHFQRMFKRITGRSPLQYRKQNRR